MANKRINKTQESFVKQLEIINPNIEVLGKYKNLHIKILCRCKIDGHEWSPQPNSILYNKSKCPVCTNQSIKVGVNDMWTINPEIAKLLADPEDGYKYTQGSNKKVNWKCPDCGNIIKNKAISAVKRYNRVSCDFCSDGISLPEKFVSNILGQLNIDFCTQKIFAWSNRKRYDVYIPSYNCIIEIHGEQHYLPRKRKTDYKNLQKEQKNDLLKYEMAKLNGISKYIQIDMRKSSFEYMYNSILKSELCDLFDLMYIDFKMAYKTSFNSKMIEACELWESGINNTNEISKLLGLSQTTITSYLNKGMLVKICSYDPDEAKQRKVICLNTLEVFDSIKNASLKYNINAGSIGACCANRKNHAGKLSDEIVLKWMYYDEYSEFISKGEEVVRDFTYINGNNTPVCQYNYEGDLINSFSSIKKAVEANLNNNVSGIVSCCTGINKSSGGYVWRYKDDEFNKYNLPENIDMRIFQYNLKGEFIAIYKTQKNAAEANNLKRSAINRVCKGEMISTGGYVWRYANDDFDKYLYNRPNKVMKPVNQYDINNKFIKTFCSISEAAKAYNLYNSNIVRVCTGRAKTSGGYIWKYAS